MINKKVTENFLETLYHDLENTIYSSDEFSHIGSSKYDWALQQIKREFPLQYQYPAEDLLSEYARAIHADIFCLGCQALLSFLFIDHPEMIDVIQAYLQDPKPINRILYCYAEKEKQKSMPIELPAIL